MKYATAAAFRQGLQTRLKQEAEAQGVSVDRLRKRVVFERLLARLRVVARGRWALKGALALDFRNPMRARSNSPRNRSESPKWVDGGPRLCNHD